MIGVTKPQSSWSRPKKCLKNERNLRKDRQLLSVVHIVNKQAIHVEIKIRSSLYAKPGVIIDPLTFQSENLMKMD